MLDIDLNVKRLCTCEKNYTFQCEFSFSKKILDILTKVSERKQNSRWRENLLD